MKSILSVRKKIVNGLKTKCASASSIQDSITIQQVIMHAI